MSYQISKPAASATRSLDIEAFALLLGERANSIPARCKEMILNYNFNYKTVSAERFRVVVLQILQVMDSGRLSVSGEDRRMEWEKGWTENLDQFVASGYDLKTLTPKYMQKFKIRRLFKNYIDFNDDEFEMNFYRIHRYYLFENYLRSYDTIYEFGCGTGYNLVLLSQLFPDKKLIGLDWTDSSVALLKKLATAHQMNIEAKNFDFYHPDKNLDILPNSAFITMGSLEQIGSDYQIFLDFILDKKPPIVINSEPFYELYDEDNLVDYLAIKYHEARNYLNGYLQALWELEKLGKIEIVKTQRVESGNLFHDPYSYVVLHPKND